MNNYLLQILKETKTIIIPGLGALTVTNETTGEIMFMSFLKHDDGNLAKYISEKEGMDINDAKNLIAKYVREIQAEVDKGEKYSMYQFGSFYKLDGEVAFEQWFTGSPEITSTDTSSTPVNPAQPPLIEKAVEIPVAEEKPIVPPTPVAEEKPVVETSTTAQSPIEKEIVVPPIIEKKLEEEKPKEDASNSAKSPVQEEKITVPPVESVKIDTPKAETSATAQSTPKKEAEPAKTTTKSPKEQLKAADASTSSATSAKPIKKKTGVFAYILWGFVVLILGAGTYVAVQFDSLKKDFPILAELAGEEVEKQKDTTLLSLGENDPVANPDSMPEVENVPGDENIEAEPAVEEPVEESKPEPVKKPAPVVTKPVSKPKPTPKPVTKPAKPAPKPVVVKPTPKPAPAPKPVPTPTYTSKPRPVAANFPTPDLGMPYHVIVGSFSSKMNARNFATKLKGLGMTNLTIGEKDGLYKVSVKGYSTEEEAKAAVPSLRDVAPNAWVFNWK